MASVVALGQRRKAKKGLDGHFSIKESIVVMFSVS